jgi:hypothetical protein
MVGLPSAPLGTAVLKELHGDECCYNQGETWAEIGFVLIINRVKTEIYCGK